METLLLNKTDVGSLIDLDDVYKAVENGYRSFAKGHVVQPDFMTIVKRVHIQALTLKAAWI